MANLLATFQPVIGELLMKVKFASSMLPVPTPSLAVLQDPPKINGNSITAARKRVESKVSEEAEKIMKEAEEAVNTVISDAQAKLEEMVKNVCVDNAALFQELQMEIADLGVAVYELSITAAGLPVRFAILAPSIIGACPLGPTVQPTQLLMTLKQFKEIGDDLGTKYSKVQASFNKLSLDQIQQMAANLPIPVPGLDTLLSAISPVLTIVKSVLDLAKPFIMLVGGSISDISSKVSSMSTISYRSNTSLPILPMNSPGISTYATESCFLSSPDETGEAEQPEVPDVGYDADPENCVVFSPRNYYDDEGHYYRTAANCKNFTVLDKTKKEPDGSIKPDCQNCTKYKEINSNITKTVTKLDNEMYGEDGTKENPKSGSVLYRMSSVEGRCTSLEDRATKLEDRATKLEDRATKLEDRATKLEDRATKLEDRATVLEGRCDVLEDRATVLEGRCDVLEDRATKLEGRCDVLETKVDEKMGWTLEAGVNEDDGYLWIDLKNSKGEVLGAKDNGHSSSVLINSFDTSLKELRRENIYEYKSMDEDLKSKVRDYLGIVKDRDPEPTGTMWAINSQTGEIDYEGDSIPVENRMDGNVCIVFLCSKPDVSPIWVNITFLGRYYNFLSSLDSTTQQYMSLDFEEVDENFATSVIAKLKYTPPTTE